METLLRILPLSIVMISGMQIVISILLAMSKDRVKLSAYYLLGSALGMSVIVGLTYFTGFKLSISLNLPKFVDWIVVVLLAFAMISSFVNRNKAKKTTRKSVDMTSGKALFMSGLALFSIFPTDMMTNMAVGSTLSTQSNPLGYFLTYLLLTLFILALPQLIVQVIGERAEPILTKARELMNKYSWVINEAICALLIIYILAQKVF